MNAPQTTTTTATLRIATPVTADLLSFDPATISEEEDMSSAAGKAVRFEEGVTLIPTPSPLDQLDGEAEWCNIWYHVSDMEAFRVEAREICRKMREENDTATAATAEKEQRTCTLARDHLSRGLEQRACLERQRRRYLSNNFIAKVAQEKFRGDAVKLALVAQRVTGWATALAIEEARRDYHRAYGCTDATCGTVPEKKRAIEDDCSQRRVRQRVNTSWMA